MLLYLTQGGCSERSMTGRMGEVGASESILVVMLSKSVLRNNPGLSLANCIFVLIRF